MKKNIKRNSKIIDRFLKRYFKNQNNSNLIPVMKYGTLFGGKKIRSTIILNTAKIFNLNMSQVVNICAAVECIHSYSLIHDDLPCMDNDSLRRGTPSTHKKYGEATAVLAGNSLLTLAFEIIVNKKNLLNLKQKNEIIELLSNCAGHTGIAGGQELDLRFENKNKKLNQILDMQRKKTGKLFNFCIQSVAIIGNKNNKEKILLGKLGEDIGLLFQLTDDFLDIKGSKKVTGKQIKKDNKKGKATLIRLLGYENTLRYADKLEKKILLKLKKHGKNAKDLINTLKFIKERNF